jgi:hypothetical protein
MMMDMRLLALSLTVLLGAQQAAQAQAPPQTSTITEQTATPPSAPPPSTTPPQSTTTGPAPSATADPVAPMKLTVPSLVTPGMQVRWQRARVMYTFGSVTGLVGTGLTLSSILVVAITGYPCNPKDPQHLANPNDTCNENSAFYNPPSPTDPAPLLAYLGSSMSAFGFIFSTAGLAWQHHLLDEVGADPGRGVFAGGTSLGLLGFLSVGTSYFFGFTHYLSPHDQELAILSTSITGAVLCAVGSLLYTIDSSRTRSAWRRLGGF